MKHWGGVFVVNLRNSRQNKFYVKEYSDRDSSSAIEAFVYESKPVFYFFFALIALRLWSADALWIKYASTGILLFSLYISYCRMAYRGYLR